MRKPSGLSRIILLNLSPDKKADLPRSLLDRLKDFRSNLYASARFQSVCSRFFLTRPIARANAGAVFDLCAGFVYTQILYTCVRTDLLAHLRAGPMTPVEATSALDMPMDGVLRLFKAACALNILETRSGGRYGLGSVGAAVLGNPGLQSMILHNGHLYVDLAKPVELLKARSKETELANYWAYSRATTPTERPPEYVSTYSDLMSQTVNVIAQEVINAYPIKRHKRMLDVGGGDGAFLQAVAERVSGLELMLLDLPPVAQLAEQRFEAGPHKAAITGANMFEDAWPEGADLITLIRVALDHDDDAVMKLYTKARAALKPGATLLIAEQMSDSPKIGDGYFGLYLWAMGSGRARTAKEHCQMLEAAGFQKTKVIKTAQPILARIVIAS